MRLPSCSWRILVPLRFVTSLAFQPPAHLAPLAKAADEAGFDAVALSDHVIHPEKLETPYPYTDDGKPRWEPFTNWPDPWVTAGALLGVTERLRVISSVFVLPMRNPFLVAKAVGTAAVLSGGRVALGVGAGWMADEFELMEQPFPGRGRRMDEMIEVLRQLWQGGWVEHHGEFYDFPRLEMSPVPEEEIPILVGGLSKRALERAASVGDGWISDLHSTEELAGLVSMLGELRAAGPRANRPFQIVVSCNDAFDLDGYRRLQDLGITHLNTMPWLFYGADPNSLEEKCDGLHRFADDILQRI
ncbi:MAG: TIGR03619 family F420-dependent LLM class oxidoreductase [bacterium]|nr:TIGR03619 family F420-dependent LLM class oxidoreductase [bacterium]